MLFCRINPSILDPFALDRWRKMAKSRTIKKTQQTSSSAPRTPSSAPQSTLTSQKKVDYEEYVPYQPKEEVFSLSPFFCSFYAFLFADRYKGTAMMLSESAIALTLKTVREQQEGYPEPSASTYGFLTPSSALGDELVERLQARGMEFKAIEN